MQRPSYQAKPPRMFVCQPVCVTPLYHQHNSIKKCLSWALVHTHQSVSVAPLLPTDGNLRRTVGGRGSLDGTPPPAHFSLSSHSLRLLHPPTPSFSTFTLTKQKEHLERSTGRPQNLSAGSGSLGLLKDESNPAFDTTGWIWKQARMKYSYKNYKVGSIERTVCWNFADVFASSVWVW